MAKVKSPHVVTVHRVGRDQGQPFLVMELLDGEDLAARLRRGPLEIDEALDCALDAVAGLRVAASAGLVHRDVKPANLFLVAGRVKLTDFGLARPVDGSADLTQAGLVVGSADYMAPEIARGAEGTLLSDIYALGATLYQLLTGHPVFEGQSPLEVISAHLTSPPRRLEKARPGIPPGLAVLVHKMLAKRPEGRYADYQALEEALCNQRDRLRAAAKRGAPPVLPSLRRSATAAGVAQPSAAPVGEAAAASAEDAVEPTPAPVETEVPAAAADIPVPTPVPLASAGGAVEPSDSRPLESRRVVRPRFKTLSILVHDLVTPPAGQSDDTAISSSALQDTILKPVLKHFRGEVVKTEDTWQQVTFASPTDAVLCGAALQDRVFEAARGGEVDPEQEFRVAIAGGEVELKRAGVVGEPVKIVANLHRRARAGQVVLSDAIYATMNKAEVETTALGDQHFQGVGRPVPVYAVVAGTDPQQPPYGRRALGQVRIRRPLLLTTGLRKAARRTGASLKAGLGAARRAATSLAGKAPGRPAWLDRYRGLPGGARLALATTAALLLLIGVGVFVRMLADPDPLERIASGESAQVLAELDAIPAAERSPADELVRGHALVMLEREEEATAAFISAAAGDARDAQSGDFLFSQLTQRRADDVIEAFVTWPDAAIEQRLIGAVEEGEWWFRHNALRVLEGRAASDKVDVQALAIRDLETGSNCRKRRYGVKLLVRSARDKEATKALRRASKRMPDNLCILMDINKAEGKVRKRLRSAGKE